MPHHNFKGAKTNKGLGLAFLLIKCFIPKRCKIRAKVLLFPLLNNIRISEKVIFSSYLYE